MIFEFFFGVGKNAFFGHPTHQSTEETDEGILILSNPIKPYPILSDPI